MAEGEQASIPGLPAGADLFLLDDFAGINTRSPRTSIEQNQFSWLENFFPVGEGNLRVLYGQSAAIYTAVGKSIVYKYFYNIGSTAYAAAFLSDGTAVQIKLSDNSVTNISAAANTFYTGGQLPHCAQYGSKYLIIVSNITTKAYWIWNGTTLFSAGGISPVVTITAGGTGYSNSFAVTFTGGGGAGATATATAVSGVVTSVTVTNPGTGYTSAPTPDFTAGGGAGATGTAALMPSGTSGTAVETYLNRVWIVNGNNLIYSAPASITDFATSSGGGTSPFSDSFLREKYVGLKQARGFLYAFGDSCVVSISNVQTSGTPPTTTFVTTPVDPQVGTPYRDSILPLGDGIVFVNSTGVYTVVGGSAIKVSDELDGLFASATLPTGSGVVPVSSLVTVYGIRLFSFLIQAVDPFTGLTRKIMCMWDTKKWFISSQESDYIFIAPQTLNSVLSSYGTDGTSIYKMFSRASSSLVKKGKTRLWEGKSHLIDKQALASYCEGAANISTPYVLSCTIDTNAGSSAPFNLIGGGFVSIVNNAGAKLKIVNNVGSLLSITTQGLSITGIDQGGVYGKYLGMSFTSQSEDYTISSVAILYKDYRFYR